MIRLHWSTWIVLVCVTGIGIAANIGGDEGRYGEVAFGWLLGHGNEPVHRKLFLRESVQCSID